MNILQVRLSCSFSSTTTSILGEVPWSSGAQAKEAGRSLAQGISTTGAGEAHDDRDSALLNVILS